MKQLNCFKFFLVNTNSIEGKILNGTCHISQEGKEHIIYEYEVLVNFLGEWLQTSGKITPFRAIVGGRDLNGESYYIGRVKLPNGQTLGRVHPSHGCCYVLYDDMEYKYEQYEVLCSLKEVHKKSFYHRICNK